MDFLTSYKWASILFCNAHAAWEMFLTYRQYRHVKNAHSVPPEFESDINQGEFRKANAYSVDRLRLSLVSALVDTATTTALLATNAFPALWYWTTFEGTFLEGSLGHCMAAALFGDVFETAVSLPLDLYSTFVVEQRHGFNNQTLGLYFLDMVKGKLVKFALMAPVTAGFLYILENFGPRFPLYMGSFLTAFSLVMAYVYPTLIQPLFNKYATLPAESPLRAKIEDMALKLKFPLKQVYTVDSSIRSNHGNAYFYGFFNNKRIVIYDTLLKEMEGDDRALLGVLGHEFGHWKLKHTIQQLILGVVQIFGTCYGASKVMYNRSLYHSFGFHTYSPVIGVCLFSIAIMPPIEALLGLLLTAWTRRMEFQADAFAVDLGYAKDLSRALLALRKQNAMTVVFDKLYAMCKYSHPPLLHRLRAISDCEERRQKKVE